MVSDRSCSHLGFAIGFEYTGHLLLVSRNTLHLRLLIVVDALTAIALAPAMLEPPIESSGDGGGGGQHVNVLS
ncbi:hypothetical protein G6M89_17965 [Natronolimnobius sp. AArcel1]|uniref:hypothetical protein n=1 Tax=Natronolimnobius sp. AArcel1 TaxID=1679093 RepID=UPI0013EAE714|nr:hypothetical protein [Natronolimnobius sp. AArcel1]NGM70864.1 hypothetical protein [Natronolimnobius sp. AArcel1]